MPPSDKTPSHCVMGVNTEWAMLQRESKRLAHKDAECEKLMELYEPLKELDAGKMEMKPHGSYKNCVLLLPCSTKKSERFPWDLEDEECHHQSSLHSAFQAAPGRAHLPPGPQLLWVVGRESKSF
ncbi:hypothetical protein HJG60_012203 [Phyllostomus discolor]|uniref:Uncharacterized protein n=1 Tax=Phyllostomus discolor TaxID=89673 RepID=A0A834DSC7_9CHIR|nr:hypothetical protein HJG60_012203 [Phyllostomus discolor]